MNIEPCRDREDLLRKLESLVTRTPFEKKGVDASKINKFIQNNLKLIASSDDLRIKQTLLQLSDRIIVEFNTAEAHQLAFQIMGFAKGILPEGAKPDLENFPEEIFREILQHVPPRRRNLESPEVESRLKPAAETSKMLKEAASKAKQTWVSEEAVSLRTYGCKTVSDAVEFLIKIQNIQNVNLLDFPDLTDDHLEKLFKNCKNINSLLIKSNYISKLPAEAAKLQKLFCSDCPINALPNEMNKLQTLDCNFCPIAALPEGMNQLQRLSCIICPITALPEGMNQLQRLSCTRCPITALPEGMNKLQKLVCARCPITALPKGMNQLQELTCNYCPITALPKGMNQLQRLSCIDCPITALPEGMSQLQRLDCGGCPITALPEGMKQLQELVCRGSPLSEIANLPVPATCIVTR